MTNYSGTAGYYRRFRPPYPSEFYADLKSRLRMDGAALLLDLGSGPGIASLPLAPFFTRLVCVDPEPGMLREGVRAAREAGVRNASWVQASAEEFDPGDRMFRLVLMANSFLWMDRKQVLRKCMCILENDGLIVMVQRRSFWEGSESWRTALLDLLRVHVGQVRRTRSGAFDRPLAGHVEVFHASGIAEVREQRFVDVRTWTNHTMLGYLYSNSFCSRALLGNCRRAFERDFQTLWRVIAPGGSLVEQIVYDAVYARP